MLAGSAAAQQQNQVPQEQGGPKSALEERFVGAAGSEAAEASAPAPAAGLGLADTLRADMAGQDAAVVVVDDESRTWTWRIAAYLWAANMDGDVTSGLVESEVDADFDDLWDDLNAAGLVLLEARSPRVAFLGDVTFLNFEQDGETPLGLDSDVDTESLVFDLIGLWRVTPTSPLEIGAGLRYMDGEFDLDPGPTFDEEIFDGVVASRLRWPFADRWDFSVYGDIGGGDSDLTWQASALLNYQFNAFGLGFGYRALDYDFEDDEDELDLLTHGFLLGLDFRF